MQYPNKFIRFPDVATHCHKGDNICETEFHGTIMRYGTISGTYKYELNEIEENKYQLGNHPTERRTIIITTPEFHFVWNYAPLIEEISKHLDKSFPIEGWDELDDPRVMTQSNPCLRNNGWTMELGTEFLSMTQWMEVTPPLGENPVQMFFIRIGIHEERKNSKEK